MTPPERFFERYTALVTESDLVAALEAQGNEFADLVRSIPAEQSTILHAPYTWTIRQVVQHVLDAERVFAYRALRFARGDPTPLPGFDEHLYVDSSAANDRSLEDLSGEFEALRFSHVCMFRTLPQESWRRSGTASNLTWSVTDLCKAIVGHARHHERIVRGRVGG